MGNNTDRNGGMKALVFNICGCLLWLFVIYYLGQRDMLTTFSTIIYGAGAAMHLIAIILTLTGHEV